MTAERIDIWDGVFLKEAEPDDFASVISDMREDDVIECDHSRWDSIDDFDRVWIVCDGDRGVFGYIGFATPSFDSYLGRSRMFAFHSTRYCDAHKLRFAKVSRIGFAKVAAMMPEWVDTAIAFVELRYWKAVEWIERIVGFSRSRTIIVNGHKFGEYVKKRRG